MDEIKLKITLADGWQQLHELGTVILSSALAAISAFGPVMGYGRDPDDSMF
ncbi:hypothetical protein LMG28727_01896 [Paraburkholderia kirstenboschensis]|uniref:hypothetical protein n=1 Tax=Paraburkholderia kirstenboschensis TaxID=1245436 RepID=UPI0013E3D4FC|nr:hypothetical protein [Paraburkholderia kirstenboschensis]CAD6523585.1 hypothetical protein LMG28727_01896 [Paraburkholderia kirstenboschensis]